MTAADALQLRLEVVQVPVADVERAKRFYVDRLGFAVDHDTGFDQAFRVVQLTPPNSSCSIHIGTGLSDMVPGSLRGLHLVVDDIETTRETLAARGVDVGEIRDLGRPGRRPFRFLFINDPDGNAWAVQEIPDAPTDPGIDMTVAHVFDARIARVWEAWTDPDRLRRWWGPRDWTCSTARLDVRKGGASLVGMRSPDGYEIHNLWEHRTVTPREELTFDQHFADADGNPLDPADLGLPPGIPSTVHHRLTFAETADGRTVLTVREEGYANQQVADISRAGMAQSLDKLAATLSAGGAR